MNPSSASPRRCAGLVTCGLIGSALLGLAAPRPSDGPDNLARGAAIRADSEYSGDYLASFVADGRVPDAAGSQDLRQAWCVQGNTHRNGAELVFEWPQAITVAEVVYYGRTAWFLSECWKDYELRAEGAPGLLAKGRLEMRHGPQRIALTAPVSTRKLTLRFTSSYGGPNPGASEVLVLAARASDKALARLGSIPGPPVDQVVPEALERLMQSLREAHGPAYGQAQAHAGRFAQLRAAAAATGAASDAESDRAWAALQRDVLLFDVDRLLLVQRHEIDSSHVYTYHNEGFRAGAGLFVGAVRDPGQPLRQLVDSPEGEILDADLSYDGTTVLFSWRRTGDEGYHLWTIGVDGSGLRQLTQGEWHDYNGCWLPDGGIGFVSTRNAQFAYCWNSPVGVVHRMAADGSQVRRLSANYLNDFTPYPLADGRLIYSRWEYVDKPAIPIQSLWTLNPDGTGLAGYYGNRVISPGTFMEARSIPGTEKIICTMTGHNGPARGAIGVIDRSRGVNAQAAIWNVTPDQPVPPVEQGNGNFDGPKLYCTPHPLDGTRFLVSARGPVWVRDLAGTCLSTAVPKPENGRQWFCAQPIRPRPRPPVIPASLALARAEGSARLMAVDTLSGAVLTNMATVVLHDLYNGLEPQVKRGEVKRLRVVREMPKTVRIHPEKRAFGFQFPVISAGATYAGKDVLGEVDVAPDGSACFEVPAEIPIYFIALDAHGRGVQRMRSFTHLMPGEVQGCVGCHESRHHTASLQQLPAAMKTVPQKLQPPEWGRGGFDYARVVQPVLNRFCSECHSGPDPKGKIDLSSDFTDYFNVSYETLARGRKQSGEAQWDSPYVSWIPSYNGFEQNILQIEPKSWGSPKSKLAEIVLANHPDAEGKPRVQLDDASRRRILAWIDLNVPYYGSSETTHPENPGSRRLYPADLDKTLASVAARRCAACHKDGRVPRPFWTRITHPELNRFLQAPLAKAAGGTEACGRAVFASTDDPDYRAILRTFDQVLAEVQSHPRMDMPGAQPSLVVNRSCK